MAISVTLVGAQDKSLEERFRAAGMRATTIDSGSLQMLTQPMSVTPDVIVLDLRADQQIPSVLALVKRQHPDIGLIVVASTLDPALMLDAMRSGVTECITELDRGQLEAAISRLVDQRTAPNAGDVFVFVGAKGGVGTTTAAVNIATALSKIGSTLVMDLHLAGGDTSLFLGADSRFSVMDALENTHRLDTTYFRGLLTRTKARPDLLASTDRATTTAVDPPRIRALIEFAANHYRYTVIDIPRSDAAVLDSLDGATQILVVAHQDLATVRSAGRVAAMLRARYGKEKVTVLLSRSDRQAEIGLEDVERALGAPVGYVFPSDYRLAVKALNHGEPVVLDMKTPLAKAFNDYANELAGIVKKESGGLFGRLTGRR